MSENKIANLVLPLGLAIGIGAILFFKPSPIQLPSTFQIVKMEAT